MVNLPQDNKLGQTLDNQRHTGARELDYTLHPVGLLFYEGQENEGLPPGFGFHILVLLVIFGWMATGKVPKGENKTRSQAGVN